MERLKAFAHTHGVEKDPAGLGKLIGKKPNQASNLINGWSPFGEKVARSIEKAAGLPTLWLDADSGLLADLPPKVATVAAAMAELPEPQLDWLLELVLPALETAKNAATKLAAANSQPAAGETVGTKERRASTK